MKAPRLITFIFIFCVAPAVSAMGISVSPSRQELVVDKGGVYEGTYTVTNETQYDTAVTVIPKDWFLLKENIGIATTDWLHLSAHELQLKAGETAELGYRIVIPRNAQGVLIAMVSFITPSSPGSNINVSQGVSTYVTVRGTEKKAWEIGDIHVELSSTSLRVSVPVADNGNVHIRPRGKVVVTDEHKLVVAKLDLPYGQPVYPGQSRSYEISYSGLALKPGKYLVTAEISCDEQVKRKSVKSTIR